MVDALNISLFERYSDRIVGVLSCDDRIVITGTLSRSCHTAGMTRFLKARQICFFDFPRPSALRRAVARGHSSSAEQLSATQGVRIKYIAKVHMFIDDAYCRIIYIR